MPLPDWRLRVSQPVPAVIPLLLMMIPSMLSALSVVREKELGSIINLYVDVYKRQAIETAFSTRTLLSGERSTAMRMCL